MQWISVILIGLIGSILVITVKEYKPEIAIVLSISLGIVMLLSASRLITPIFDQIKELLNNSSVSLKNLNILIKALGICYLTQFVSDICKDSGQTSISTKVELVGRITICLLAIPLYQELLVLIKSIIEGI